MKPFRILTGPEAEKTFEVGEKPFRIGRGQDQDLVLADDRASMAHAELVARDDKMLACDRASSNGTFVNGNLIDEIELREGDVLRVGNTEIRYGDSTRSGGPVSVAPIRLGPLAKGRSSGRATSADKTQIMQQDRAADPVKEVPVQTGPQEPVDRGSGTIILPDQEVSPAWLGPTHVMPDEADGEVVGPPVAAGGGSAPFGTMEDLAGALVRVVVSLASAKGIALHVEAATPPRRLAESPWRMCVALAEALELTLLFLGDERQCTLRVDEDAEGRPRLTLLVTAGLRPSERKVATRVDYRFGTIVALAHRCGGRFDLAPEGESDVVWRLSLPAGPEEGSAAASPSPF